MEFAIPAALVQLHPLVGEMPRRGCTSRCSSVEVRSLAAVHTTTLRTCAADTRPEGCSRTREFDRELERK